MRAACFITQHRQSQPPTARAHAEQADQAAADGQGVEAEQVTLRLKVEDGTVEGKYIEGECLLTSASMQMAVGEVLSAEIAFEFVGAPRDMLI